MTLIDRRLAAMKPEERCQRCPRIECRGCQFRVQPEWLRRAKEQRLVAKVYVP